MKFLTTLILLLFPLIFNAKTTIDFWHAMPGQTGIALQTLVDDFNQSQPDYEVIPVYKGNYHEVLTSTIANFRAGRQPAIVQVYEIGSATMINPPGIIVPVYKLLEDYDNTIDLNDLLTPITAYYADNNNQLLSLPFNSSTPILYFNKEAFTKAKLNINKPPTTWEGVEQAAQALLRAGYSCGFTNTYPSWVHIENFAAWHNIPVASQENGFAGLDTQLTLTHPMFIFHINKLAEWEREGVFQYGGKDDNAGSRFISQICPMLITTSGSYIDLQHVATFDFGVSNLPYWENLSSVPQNTLIGGASLWVLTGHDEDVYQGITNFFEFLMQPENQAFWSQQTGYIALTKQAYQLNQQQGYYDKFPGMEMPFNTLLNKPPTEYSRGIRLGYLPTIRDIIEQQLEATWAQQITAEQALHKIEDKSNPYLQRFYQISMDE